MTDVEQISRKGPAVPISWFPFPEGSEVPGDLRGLFRKAREKIGFVPNVFRAYSFRPERLRAWFNHYKQLHEPTENRDGPKGDDRGRRLDGERVPLRPRSSRRRSVGRS